MVETGLIVPRLCRIVAHVGFLRSGFGSGEAPWAKCDLFPMPCAGALRIALQEDTYGKRFALDGAFLLARVALGEVSQVSAQRLLCRSKGRYGLCLSSGAGCSLARTPRRFDSCMDGSRTAGRHARQQGKRLAESAMDVQGFLTWCLAKAFAIMSLRRIRRRGGRAARADATPPGARGRRRRFPFRPGRATSARRWSRAGRSRRRHLPPLR